MKKRNIKRILVIRFRQIGDTVLSTALCSSLKRSFPEAEIHIILNEGIAPVVSGHPDIDKAIPFNVAENKSTLKYIRNVWKVINQGKYDIIVDMRSTVKTLLFSLLSLLSFHTPIRVGRKKWYSSLLLNHTVDNFDGSMIEKNQLFANTLSYIAPIAVADDFRLFVSEDEKIAMKRRMEDAGIDFSCPILLAGVTTKLLHKRWNIEYMQETISRIMQRYSNVQIIFNYAPGKEEEDAKEIFSNLGSPSAIKINIEAVSLRELLALCSNCTFYFGNEGGTRHVAQALGIPSYAIFSPTISKKTWLPQNNVPAYGIEAVYPRPEGMNNDEIFNTITPDKVCKELFPLLDNFFKKNQI